jgi:hypothetical protein
MSAAPRFPPDVRALRRALEPGGGATRDAHDALAGLAAHRAALADPLGAHARASAPDAALRASLVARPEVSLPGVGGGAPLRLAPDAVSVAVALADELWINERDAAVLLSDAGGRRLRRADRDVVAAAKEIYYERRRGLVLFLQEMLRVHLLGDGAEGECDEDGEFRQAVRRERDGLVAEHGVVGNVVARLAAGLPSLGLPTAANPRPGPANRADALENDEAVLLAECLFLMAYSVQMSSRDALAVRELLEAVVQLVAGVEAEEDAAAVRSAHAAQHGGHELRGGVEGAGNEGLSFVMAKARSVRELMFLSWMCCIDRSRYSDLYDPRTGLSGVNALLTDLDFVKRSCRLPSFNPEDEQAADLPPIAPTVAAAELCGAVFRMTVAEPDAEEPLSTVLRTCAFADALEYLGSDLAAWIETGAGSLLPDMLLYADAFEDFAIDLCEAPDLALQLMRFTQEEVMEFEAVVTAASQYESGGYGGEAHVHAQQQQHGAAVAFGPAARCSPNSHSTGKPPKPPLPGRLSQGRNASSPSPSFGGGRPGSVFGRPNEAGRSDAFGDLNGGNLHGGDGAAGTTGGPRSATKPKNFVVLLGRLVEQAVTMAPTKLLNPSVGGDRYWSGVGPDSLGLVRRMSECILDMSDASFRSSDSGSLYEVAYREALEAFLKVLAATATPGGNSLHAGLSLRYLCNAGHSVVSLDNALLELTRHFEALSTPATANLAPVTPADTRCLMGLLDIIRNCAESIQSQGMSSLIGRGASELPPRVTALALQDVSSKLRSVLVRTLMALGDTRSTLMFLDEIVKNKAAKLRQMIRGPEAELGVYDGTIAVFDMATKACLLTADEYSSYAMEAVAIFAVDEVVSHWSQRNYASDEERWRLMRHTNDFLLAIVDRESHLLDGHSIATNIFSKLLCPAPGTGAASPALRALISCAGLRRSVDDPFLAPGPHPHGFAPARIASSGAGRHGRSIEGREALAQAALSGDGAAFREMEAGIVACARVLSYTLSLVPRQFSSHTMITARASDLLLSEPRAIVAAGSLVFATDECEAKPTPFRLGYAVTSCAAVLSMLATAASQSTLICKLLTRTDESSASIQFRCSLADVIACYSASNGIGGVNVEQDLLGGRSGESHDSSADIEDGASMLQDSGGPDDMSRGKDVPRIHSALHLVEACLGRDGGGKPGLFLLGLALDSGDRLKNSDYGVLSVLMELVSGVGQCGSNRIDDRSRATAAVFLERLAGNTTANTSCAVLEFIRHVGGSEARGRSTLSSFSDASVGWFGDTMLGRVLDLCALPQEDMDWSSLGQLAGACMKLSALLVRQYPDEELASFENLHQTEQGLFGRRKVIGSSPGCDQRSALPSPDALLRFAAAVAGHGNEAEAVDAFRNWHQLLGSRLSVHPQARGYGAIPLLLDITTSLLDSLESSEASGDMNVLVSQDGGAEAASVVLRCLGHIASVATLQSQCPKEFLGDSQAGVLLAKVVRAIASRTDGRGDAVTTRTSLYASFLVCGQLTEAKSSDENITQAFGGRMGPRQTSGAEALVAIACEDSISGPAAATRAAALVSLAVAARLDPLRVIPALSSQNRLRRVVCAALSEPHSQAMVVRSCTRLAGKDEQAAAERSAVVVAEAVVTLIHAVASGVDGVRALSDAACLESIASLLEALSNPRHRVQAVFNGSGVTRRDHLTPSRHEDGRYKFGGQADSDADEDVGGYAGTWGSPTDTWESPEERLAAIAGMLTAAVGAAVRGSDSILADGALVTLDAGESLYARLIRSLVRPRLVYFSAVSHLSVVLSRIPTRILSDGAIPSRLRSLLACHVGCFVPAVNFNEDMGKSGSAMSACLNRVSPRDAREVRRSEIEHPEGGSLFERDLVSARLECLNCVFTALRPPVGLLTFFSPRLTPGGVRQHDGHSEDDISGFVDELSGRQAHLGEILRIAQASLATMQTSAEESMRLLATVADETQASIPSRRFSELMDYCMEELDIDDEEHVTSETVLACLREAAAASRRDADACVALLESALYILREYTNAASEVLRSSNYSVRHTQDWPLSVRDAELLLEEATTVLMPFCGDVDSLSTTVWGRQDPSFCRQLGRQIRTNLSSH